MLGTLTAASLTPSEVLERVITDPQIGLRPDDVLSRRVLNGTNELIGGAKVSLWSKIVEKIREPLMLLLLSSSAVSIATSQFDDAISILIVS
jgi:P-type Ca2+ transporter type 2C